MPSEKRERQREGRLARQEELRLAQQRAKRRRQLIITVVLVLGLGGVFYLATRGGAGKSLATSTTTSTTSPGAAPANVGCPQADGSSPRYRRFAGPPPTCIDRSKTYTISLQTDVGTIAIKLDQTAGPKAANNFVFLAGYHFFDGTIFHRVIPNFVDQGGDPTGSGSGGPGYTFADEVPKAGAYKAGSFAMANSGPNTNGSQFFIVASDSGGTQLQPLYSLFGQVTTGMDVVSKINADGDPSGTPKVVHKVVKATIVAS